MRLTLLSSWLLVLLFGVALSAPAVNTRHRDARSITTIQKRAETDTSPTTADNLPSSTSTDTMIDTHSATTATAIATMTASQNTTSTNHSHSPSVATTIPSLDGSTASNGNAQDTTKQNYTGGLPLQPQITPAWGVGGIILLLLGAAQAFIGIRKQWAHIFLSTGFLAALGITVLIVYVMNPPVSNAVQGGYLVAVFFTGAVMGGLALVFREITEGLGCLLGGFCIAMWLLTVKSGGLVTDTGAKTGLIIAVTVAFWSLSFSHYTRSYGLILCTSVSGATAVVLGIDCYSRAGLKEFWAYLWNLNPNMFPLNTYTYPVTRNIRVELAITVIVTVFGVIAQMRLWKVIKERRLKEETSRKEAEKQKEEADAEVGRQLEEKNLRERAEWEHMYGNGSTGKAPSMTETAVAGDSRRGSDGFKSSTPEHEKDNSVEMKDMSTHEQPATALETGSPVDTVDKAELEPHDANQNGEIPQHEETQGSLKVEQCHEPQARPVTMWPEPMLREDRGSEHGAVVGSEPGSPQSKRFSGRSLMKRLSWRSGNGTGGPTIPKLNTQSESEEALVVQDDATSSVFGVADDISSLCPSVPSDSADTTAKQSLEEAGMSKSPQKNVLAELTESGLNVQATRGTPIPDESDAQPSSDLPSHISNEENRHRLTGRGSEFQIHQDDDAQELQEAVVESKQEESHPAKPECIVLQVQPSAKPAVLNHETASQSPLPEDTVEHENRENQAPHEKLVKEVNEHDSPGHREDEAEREAEREPDSISQAKALIKSESARLDTSTVKEIPEQTSTVVHTFRTNEWAKQLADAEIPEIEPIQLVSESSPDSDEPQEIPAPVNVEGLLQTPLNGMPPPVFNSNEQTAASLHQSRRHSQGSAVTASGLPRSQTKASFGKMSTARSPPPMARNLSSLSLLPSQEKDHKPGPLRSISTPFLTIASHSQEQQASDSPRWSGPPPLLAVRENMMRNRISSTSLRYDPYASRSQSRLSLADPTLIASPPSAIPEERDEKRGPAPAEDADDVPLSKRRDMLQRQTLQSPSSSSLQSIDPARSPLSNSSDPARSAAVMAAWRQSVREDLSHRRDLLSHSSPPPNSGNAERPRALRGPGQPVREPSAAQVEKVIADKMQRGSMTDLHRQAMRRMQASANRKL